jgi:hypothetical protein
MKIYLDTEFIEDGRTIDLLSVGLVRDDGAEYYAEPRETDRTRADDWVKANVLPHLTGVTTPRQIIAEEITAFVGPAPEFWGYYCAYDWVALCRLYGTLMDLPSGWPMLCRDLRQLLDDRGHADITQPDDMPHHAMSDAHWIADTFRRYG